MNTTQPNIQTNTTDPESTQGKPKRQRPSGKARAQKKRDALKNLTGPELFVKARNESDPEANNAMRELQRRASSGDAGKWLTIAKAGSLRSVKAEHQLRECLGISQEFHTEFLQVLKTWR